MADQKQFCPILTFGRTAAVPCKGIECAMFVHNTAGSNPLLGKQQPSGCSLKVIAQMLVQKLEG